MMRKLRLLVVAAVLALGSAPVTAHADPIVCHDYPGGCCGDVTVAGKTILTINC